MTLNEIMNVRTNDIIKRKYDQQNELHEKHGGLCKGLCKNYIAQRPTSGDRYANGQARCTTCEVFLTPEGIIANGKNRCKCCHFQVRTRPRNSQAKQQYFKQVQNYNQKQDSQSSESEKKSENIIDEEIPIKKSTPIYEQTDASVKTYYEFKEFLDHKIKLQSNYQLVMLKELLEYGTLHKGEIAESLTYFNNKDPSNIDSVKYYFDVPVYNILLEHGVVLLNYDLNHISHYSLNVKLTEFQKLELHDLLVQRITNYNLEHNIPDNEFPHADNMGCIDWAFSINKKLLMEQKTPNANPESKITPEMTKTLPEPVEKQTPSSEINYDTTLLIKNDSQGIRLTELKEIKSTVIKKGQILSNDELMQNFGVGNMGSIRHSRKNNLFILCSTESKDYHDIIDYASGLITFTGEDREGDQEVAKDNSKIVNSADALMLFFKEKPLEPGSKKRGALDNLYEFVGKVKYLKYYWNDESDKDGKIRKALKFVLEIES